VELWVQIVAGLVLLLTGGTLTKILDWLSARSKDQREFKVQEQVTVVSQWSSFMGELRGEIHALRDRLNTVLLQKEALDRENATLRAQIHSLEERLGDAATSGGVAWVTIDQEGVVVAWSPSATEIFGWSPAEAIGKEVGGLIIPEDLRPVHKAALEACVREDRPARPQPLIFKAVDKWGHPLLVELSLSSMKSGSKWHHSGTVRRRYDKFD